MSTAPARCPSAPCRPGAVILGVVQADGRVAYLPRGFVAEAAFVEAARAHGRPEARLRFSSPCLTGACAQWDGARCTVLDQHRAALEAHAREDPLPPCAIRDDCRWHRQDGAAACRLCPMIVTEAPAS